MQQRHMEAINSFVEPAHPPPLLPSLRSCLFVTEGSTQCNSQRGTTLCQSISSAQAPSAGEPMVLRIRQPAGGRGETIRVVIHRSDFGDVPDIFVPEAVLA